MSDETRLSLLARRGSAVIGSMLDLLDRVDPQAFVLQIQEGRRQRESLDGTELKVAMFGEFSSGKSSFINAVLGESLLHVANTPTTATLTYLHHSPQPRVRIAFRDMTPVPLYRAEKKGLVKTVMEPHLDKEAIELLDAWHQKQKYRSIIQRVQLVNHAGSMIDISADEMGRLLPPLREMLTQSAHRGAAGRAPGSHQTLFQTLKNKARGLYDNMFTQMGHQPPELSEVRVHWHRPPEAIKPLSQMDGLMTRLESPEDAQRIEAVHYYLPNPALRSLCLIDLPGYGSTSQAHSRLAHSLVRTAHLILFFVRERSLGSRDVDSLAEVFEQGHVGAYTKTSSDPLLRHKFAFVVTHRDRIDSRWVPVLRTYPADAVRAYAVTIEVLSKIRARTGVPFAMPLFFVDNRRALKSPEERQACGVGDVINHLESFITARAGAFLVKPHINWSFDQEERLRNFVRHRLESFDATEKEREERYQHQEANVAEKKKRSLELSSAFDREEERARSELSRLIGEVRTEVESLEWRNDLKTTCDRLKQADGQLALISDRLERALEDIKRRMLRILKEHATEDMLGRREVNEWLQPITMPCSLYQAIFPQELQEQLNSPGYWFLEWLFGRGPFDREMRKIRQRLKSFEREQLRNVEAPLSSIRERLENVYAQELESSRALLAKFKNDRDISKMQIERERRDGNAVLERLVTLKGQLEEILRSIEGDVGELESQDANALRARTAASVRLRSALLPAFESTGTTDLTATLCKGRWLDAESSVANLRNAAVRCSLNQARMRISARDGGDPLLLLRRALPQFSESAVPEELTRLVERSVVSDRSQAAHDEALPGLRAAAEVLATSILCVFHPLLTHIDVSNLSAPDLMSLGFACASYPLGLRAMDLELDHDSFFGRACAFQADVHSAQGSGTRAMRMFLDRLSGLVLLCARFPGVTQESAHALLGNSLAKSIQIAQRAIPAFELIRREMDPVLALETGRLGLLVQDVLRSIAESDQVLHPVELFFLQRAAVHFRLPFNAVGECVRDPAVVKSALEGRLKDIREVLGADTLLQRFRTAGASARDAERIVRLARAMVCADGIIHPKEIEALSFISNELGVPFFAGELESQAEIMSAHLTALAGVCNP